MVQQKVHIIGIGDDGREGLTSTARSLIKDADLVFWDIEHPDELSYYYGHNPCTKVIKSGGISL